MTEAIPEQPRLRRVFFALWPDAAALDALEAAAAAAYQCRGGRRLRRDSLHLTLAFMGDVSQAQLDDLLDLAGKLREAPFDLTLDQIGWWPRNGIFWAGCQTTPSHQRRLSNELSKALRTAGFAVDTRPHFPHVTLLRNAHCSTLPVLKTPISWRVDAFSLVESKLQVSGSLYSVLARWPLSADGPG